MTYAVFEGYMADLRKKVATIQRKCERFGCDFHFAEVGEEMREVVDPDHINPLTGKPVKVMCRFIICEAEGTAVLNDWQFIASVEHTANGNIYSKAMTDVEIPERYRTSDTFCEHCNSHRIRKGTYIVRNTQTGEFKQVGHSCLKDFTHGMSASWAAYMASLKDVFEEYEVRPVSGLGWWAKYYDTVEFLQYTAETIRHYGFSKSSDSTSTKNRAIKFFDVAHGNTRYWEQKEIDRVRDMMEQVGFDADSEEAKQMTQDALQWIAEQKETNDYMHNLRVATSLECVDSGKFGLLVSLFPTYDRELVEQARRKAEAEQGKASEYVGQVGDRVEVEVETVKCLTSWESCYNGYSTTTTYIWKIVGKDGNIYIWKTSKWLNEELPPKSIKGIVKEHKEFREVKQTELTRCKVA